MSIYAIYRTKLGVQNKGNNSFIANVKAKDSIDLGRKESVNYTVIEQGSAF